MKKIPTLFKRNPENMRELLEEVHPDCAWVQAGKGVATQKIDGTSCLIKDGVFYKRREVKPGKQLPTDFMLEQIDHTTGKAFGWVPVTEEDKWHMEALVQEQASSADPLAMPEDGTYELIGPKIQGNPEQAEFHQLLHHHDDGHHYVDVPTQYNELKQWLEGRDIEGIVWHHPDGRMAKIKLRDFGITRGQPS